MFYHGLPSKPTLVFRTGALSEKPSGPETYVVKRGIRPVVFDDKFVAIWEHMGASIHKLLGLCYGHVVRFAKPGRRAGPIVLWVGVRPGSLSRKDAQAVALACEKILPKFEIVGIEIVFRASLFRRSDPRLLNYVATADLATSVLSPLTAALGLPITPLIMGYAGGTRALCLSADCNNKTVHLLTARHVVFLPKDVRNQLHHRIQNSRCRDVMFPGAFQGMLRSTMVKVADDRVMVDQYEEMLDRL